MDEVRRPDDDELCGHVVERDGQWSALVVFGEELARFDDRESATAHVLAEGLATLAERWTLRNGTTGDEQIVCIQEANPASVTLALDYYSLPGVPTMTITADRLASGEWVLMR